MEKLASICMHFIGRHACVTYVTSIKDDGPGQLSVGRAAIIIVETQCSHRLDGVCMVLHLPSYEGSNKGQRVQWASSVYMHLMESSNSFRLYFCLKTHMTDDGERDLATQ